MNGTHTIEKDGFVRLNAQSNANGTFAAYLSINGMGVYSVCVIGAYADTALSSQFFPVKAGDVVEQFGVVNLKPNYSSVMFIEKR